ncbi:MAG TPA: MBOAT family O-acyltransferase, partial [Leptospiraceae bacterium]|nr:MBOAT family O-acyltransferase [Leptospiraceae bacterium]
GKHYLIILTSLVFYGYYSIPFLLMFLALLVINYWIGMRLIEKKNGRLLAAGVVLDVGILAFFKYFYFLAESVGHIIGSSYLIDLRRQWMSDYAFEIILPIGISFYTFQVVAFIVDCYKGQITEKVSPIKFYVFTLFFPHFVAGPIMRAPDLIPQIDRPSMDIHRMLNGCLTLLMGVVKKVLIADHLGAATGPILQNPQDYDAVYLILLMPAWAFQIYCDFSGYTDMARGLAKLMGYEIPENFTGPMLSRSYQEFWQRWHITLSMWLRDYIYIPLGGSRVSGTRVYINLLITFGIGGLWHGAAYTTVLWGLYTGVILSLERMWAAVPFRILPEGRFNWLRVSFTICIHSAGVLLFAAPSIHHTGLMLKGIFTWQRGLPGTLEAMLGLSLVALLFNVFQYYPSIRVWLHERVKIKAVMVAAATFVIGLLVNLYGDVTGSFIYFQF